MKSLLTSAAIAGTVAFASTTNAEASFHLYDIQEVFSNGDGTIQFIELTTQSNSQQFLSGHEIRVLDFANGNAIISEFTFPTNGPSPTANTTLLIATNGFSTEYGITPDFTLPTNFLSGNANYRLDFDGQDSVNLGSLPSDGVMSLDGIANQPNNPAAFAINDNATPTNYAGDTITIVPEPSTTLLGICALSVIGLRRRR